MHTQGWDSGSASVSYAYSVAAQATVRATPERLAALRRDPGVRVTPAAMRHADDQSVARLAAVLQALATADLKVETCRGWGVVAAPRSLGRSAVVQALQRFRTEGAWGVSPHLAAQQSQHAVAGFLSMMLGLRGPSFGVGGGPGSAAEAARAAVTLLQDAQLPGLWLVTSCWNPEPVLDGNAQVPPSACCHAAAFALIPSAVSSTPVQLCFAPSFMEETASGTEDERVWFSAAEQVTEARRAARLKIDVVPQTTLWPLTGGAWIEWTTVCNGEDIARPTPARRDVVTATANPVEAHGGRP